MAYLDFIMSRPSRGLLLPTLLLPLLDFAGPLAINATGAINNATRAGTTTNRAQNLSIPGESSWGMGFNGSNGTLATGNITFLNSIAKFTMTAAVYPLSGNGNYAGICGKCDLTSGLDNVILSLGGPSVGDTTSAALNIRSGSNTYAFTATGNVPINKWTHIIAVYDGTQANASRIKIYINGIAKTLTVNGTIPTTTGTASIPFRVANDASASGRFFNGYLSMVEADLFAMSAAEASLTYSAFQKGFLGTNILAA